MVLRTAIAAVEEVNIWLQDTENSNKFLGLYEIDFMNFLPSVLYKFLNPLFSGMTETVFYAVDHSVRRNTSEFKPAAAYTYY